MPKFYYLFSSFYHTTQKTTTLTWKKNLFFLCVLFSKTMVGRFCATCGVNGYFCIRFELSQFQLNLDALLPPPRYSTPDYPKGLPLVPFLELYLWLADLLLSKNAFLHVFFLNLACVAKHFAKIGSLQWFVKARKNKLVNFFSNKMSEKVSFFSKIENLPTSPRGYPRSTPSNVR